MLILEPRNEYLRDTLFWQMFGLTLIFEDFDDAVRYRKVLIKNNKSPPNMYSKDGQQILVDGILDPNAAKRSNLEYIFGMQDPRNTTLFADITSGKLLFIFGFLLASFTFRDTNHMEIILYSLFISTLFCSIMMTSFV